MKLQSVVLAVALSQIVACSSGSGDDPAPVNQAPSVSAIPPVESPANGDSQAIAFTVSDENLGSLVFSAQSDRPGLIPEDAYAFSGNGPIRTLTITPTVDMTGDAFVTVIAEDREGLAASSSFMLTVTPEQKSMQQFARDMFANPEDDEPALINAVEFAQDADEDDFADLLAQ